MKMEEDGKTYEENKQLPLVGRKSLKTAIEKLKTIAFGFSLTSFLLS